MTYEEMIEKLVQEKDDELYIRGFNWSKQGKKKNRIVSGKEYVEVDWVIGGVEGGNCYSEGGHSPVQAEPEPDLTDLDKILEILCPNILYTQYKKIDTEVVVEDYTTSYEYYGNHTEYARKRVNLKDLYEKLKDMELI